MSRSNYRNLTAWQKSRALASEIYRATSKFPRHELFGMSSQMRRCAVSIPSNVAEGHGRWTRKGCRSFLAVARGSAMELETQIIIAGDLAYLDTQTCAQLTDQVVEVCKVINGLMRYYAGASAER